MKLAMPRGVLARIWCLNAYPVSDRVAEMKSSIGKWRNPSSSLNSTRIGSGYFLSNSEEAGGNPDWF